TEKVREAYLAFLRSSPLGVQLPGGVLITHSLPEQLDERPFDPTVFERQLELAVTDDGHGMAQGVIEQAFDPFFSFYEGDHTERMYKLAEYMELDLTRRIDDLSYGNKKKVGIVQGLLHAPKLLFLDEPTSGLDPLMQRKFFDLIREENTGGVTVFFSSHILGEVQKLCSRVGIIREGSIVEVSDIQTLQQDNYKKIRVAADGLEPETFDLPGITNLERRNGAIRFFYKGDINIMMQKIASVQVADVTIEEPTLEEIFMHYYE
ncbi:MAG: AAA family ATPase, partial [Anaerolineae bacterium]